MKEKYSISEFVEEFDYFEKDSLSTPVSKLFLETIKEYICQEILLVFPAFFDFEFNDDNKSIHYSNLPEKDHYIYYKKSYVNAIKTHLSAINNHDTVSLLYCREIGTEASYLKINKKEYNLNYEIISSNTNNNNNNKNTVKINITDLQNNDLDSKDSQEKEYDFVVESLSDSVELKVIQNKVYNYDLNDSFQIAIYNHLALFESEEITIYYFFTNNLRIENVKKGFGGLFVIAKKELKDNELTFFKQINYNLSNKIAISLANRKIKLANIKSAIAAIMSRQMSHNLGSHVIPGTRYDLKNGYGKKDIVGIDRLLQYLQERMDFISMIVNTDESEKLYGALNLKAHILDELAMDGPAIRHNKIKSDSSSDSENATTNYILRHIVKSEGYYRFENVEKSEKPEDDDIFKIEKESEHKPIELQIIQLQKSEVNNEIYKYQKFTSVSNGDIPSSPFSKTDFAIPYGVNGRHAFLNILEDFIRNSAKHGKDKLTDLKSLIFTILVQTKADLEKNNIEEVGKVSNLSIKDQLKDDEYLVSILSNKPSDINELKEIKESFAKLKLLNENGSINQENKGLKEIMICLAWLKNKMSDLSIIENQISDGKFLMLNHQDSLGDYALIKNPIIPNDKDHLALRFTLKKYRFAYIITIDEFNKYFEGEKLKYDEIFKLPSSDIYILDDSNIKSTEKIIKLKKSIPKLIELSRIKNDEKEWEGFNVNSKNPFSEYIINNIDDINSTKVLLTMEHCTAIMKSYIKMKYGFSDTRKYPLLYIIRDGQEENVKGENKEIIKRTKTDDFSEITKQIKSGRKVLVFRNHNDEQDQYKVAYNGLKDNMPDFMEGISGNNFTYNLVISNVISELEYYKILDSSLTKIAIIDERIFEHHAKKNNKKIILQKDKGQKDKDAWKVEFVKKIKDKQTKHPELQLFLASNDIKMDIEAIIDFQNNEEFEVEDLSLYSNTNNDNKMDIFSGKNIFLFDMYLNDESSKENDTTDINYSIYNSEGIIQTDFSDYDYISVHFGLIEKYMPKEYLDIKKRLDMFKLNVLKIDQNSNIKLTIHSGRGNLTNLDDVVRYLPVSSIESQLTNCKHLLTQQFANVKYKI